MKDYSYSERKVGNCQVNSYSLNKRFCTKKRKYLTTLLESGKFKECKYCVECSVYDFENDGNTTFFCKYYRLLEEGKNGSLQV